MRQFSSIVSPRNSLLGKNITWKWGSEQQTAFDTLKEKLSSDSSASDFELGLVLIHSVDNKERLTCCASCKTAVQQRRNVWLLCDNSEPLDIFWWDGHLWFWWTAWAGDGVRPWKEEVVPALVANRVRGVPVYDSPLHRQDTGPNIQSQNLLQWLSLWNLHLFMTHSLLSSIELRSQA